MGTYNQTSESPKIFTRQHQTPYKRIGTLSWKSCTQELLKKKMCFVPAVFFVSSQWQDRREPNMCDTPAMIL